MSSTLLENSPYACRYSGGTKVSRQFTAMVRNTELLATHSMATNPEGILERIMLLTACAGEQGFAVWEFLASILVLLSLSEQEPSQHELLQLLGNPRSETYRTTAVIWRWATERQDVSVGDNRRYNDAPLGEILSLAQNTPSVGHSANTPPPETSTRKEDEIRIYVSEDTMWESLTGHGVDHKRIPRSEWTLLQGIASTMTKGILQGDLGRLVGQDKRSVPKRTSCLVEKGYITKRTTLVRGTKTSKLWLKFLAPSTPDESSERSEADADITLSRGFLVESLDPVPWHTKWTSDSIDYKVLATTIMATCKEWNVMRLQDLKSKLGVLGMIWQMKVVSKICRFLNARGTIQYVAAKLNNRVFKDCIRFRREMNARDWSVFLATGKRTTKTTRNPAQENVEDETSMIGVLKNDQGYGPSHCPSWCIYTPITALVAICIQKAGYNGLTNPQLCAMTIGPSFTRYLAGLTASISTGNIQPSNVIHLAVKSERGRPGKSSSLYWYSLKNSGMHRHHDYRKSIYQLQPDLKANRGRLSEPYNFMCLANRSSPGDRAPTLSDLCQSGLSHQKRRGRPRKIRPEQLNSPRHSLSPELPTLAQNSTPREACRATAQPVLLQSSEDVDLGVESFETQLHEETSELGTPAEMADEKAPQPTLRARGRPKTRNVGQIGRKPPNLKTKSASNRQFKCEKCCGTWKNDVGLKYHLEKSQTSCNPSFKPQLMPAPKNADLAGNKFHAFHPKRHTRKGTTDCPSQLPADGRSVRVKSVGEASLVRRGEGGLGLATSSAEKRQPRQAEDQDVIEDVSFLSGQAKLLTAISAAPPRQVNPFTKPLARQSTLYRHLNVMLEDSEASNGLPELQEVIFEVPEARPPSLALAPQDTASSTASAKETLETRRIKNPVRHKLMGTITDLLHQYSGALPTGQSLEILVCEQWKLRHCEEDAPSGPRIKSVMLQMIRERMIVDQWHAFRAPDGRIGKCQIITIPSVLAFAPETRTLVESIRQLYPANILPHQIPGSPLTPEDAENPKGGEEATDIVKAHPNDGKVGGRGRRSLAAGVAILSAPVYAAQIATKRTADSDDFSSSPGKRRRVAEDSTSAGDEQNNPQFWPAANIPLPSHDMQPSSLSACTGVSLDIFFDDVTQNGHGSTGIKTPVCSNNSETRRFERLAQSMQRKSWIAGSNWFSWASYHHALSQAPGTTFNDHSRFDYFVGKLKWCLNIETQDEYSAQVPIQAHKVFINFLGGDMGNHIRIPRLQWHKPDKQRTITPEVVIRADGDALAFSSASADEEPEPPSTPLRIPSFSHSVAAHQTTPTPIKRATLASRNLTSLALDTGDQRLVSEQRADVDSNELVAAFVVIRSLLGGIDKLIDWGLLGHLFPTLGLQFLRRFWARIRKEKAPLLSKATQDFQESFMAAILVDEMAIPDYERPLDYDWRSLIQWAMRHPNQEQLQLPSSREQFHREFKLEDGSGNSEDWKEKFFHPQSSVYSRFEAATLESGSLAVAEVIQMYKQHPALGTVDIARSWIRSLCCTSETEYTPQDVKDRFSMLSKDTPQRNNSVLKMAIDQLTREKVICKSKRTPFSGRPYRLNEGYISVLAKVSHRPKYLDAIAFKRDLDKAFRSSSAMKVPYTLSDGAMMALMNLIAGERIKITTVAVPNIPFGFEPGNYESRKYPKSYYHMDLEVQPTQTYLFNDNIDILELVRRVGPPRKGRAREIPQWIDFFGKLDGQKWADILGAVCFVFNTRGVTSVAGICDAMAPILDVFEAQIIVSWGIETGVFVRATQHSDIMLGEWWWLVVAQHPWS
ncbi:TFIIIC transcription initiation factor complex subunits Tfc3 [Cordyceps militaris]|uniref:TFIIIC transcription initiation factor complex subunits Tfc3 n=1 Tax=Cordyceps militaris TaxID=73501 RepID=A0A2H4STJ9_CORMI|nr:TFIIIC transcription initiation factor complex subunits Tfc3 [Cordyceps militaris]